MSERSVTRPAEEAPDRGGPFSRGVLLLGVCLTAAAFVSLVVILGAYFLSTTADPTFYALALWGFPAGFALLMLHMVLSARRRRAVRRGTPRTAPREHAA